MDWRKREIAGENEKCLVIEKCLGENEKWLGEDEKWLSEKEKSLAKTRNGWPKRELACEKEKWLGKHEKWLR